MVFVLLVAEEPTQHSAPSTQHSDTITITATRTETRLADTPASVVVLTRETIATSAAATVDDTLRQVPGFALFRRAGSRTANPTAQGVTLRGIGASGASRAVVLDDGIPLNDPFGGWVYWGRVPRVAIERVEVLRGGASDLYGSAAMGGVVQFIRRARADVSAEVSGGSHGTGTTSIFAGSERASVAIDLFTTSGHVLVQPSQRGPVDVEADSEHASIDATLRHAGAFLRASYFRESRQNGTPLQFNDTAIRQLALGYTRGALLLRAYGSDQDYRQTFTAVAADRASERLTVDQRVPSRGFGGSAQWSRAIATRHALVAGVEHRDVLGTSDELRGTARVAVGGRQQITSAFVEDVFAATPDLSISAGLRVDSWRDTAWSPRLSMLYRANDNLALTASAYRAFRAPTLNELYRGFRVGNIQTNANENLGPERLSAVEVGARLPHLRATLFWMSMTDTIANVTISQTPSLITRQRRNLGGSRSRGVELESDWRIGTSWRASAGYLFADATTSTDRRVPQVPRHQATAQLLYTRHITAALQARWSGMQFDDDLNELPLRSYFVADAFASYPLTSRIAATLAVENLFDRRVETSATPVITLGHPRAWRVGVRYTRQ